VNVGTGVAHSLQEMLAAVGDALDRPVTVELHPVESDDPNATLADPTRLLSLTGLRPRTDLPALVRRQAAEALGSTDRADAHPVDAPFASTPQPVLGVQSAL